MHTYKNGNAEKVYVPTKTVSHEPLEFQVNCRLEFWVLELKCLLGCGVAWLPYK